MSNQEQLEGIIQPHANDVLSGRGNFVNHHSGNENFRALVKHHKKAYVACPKSQKAIYSKLIYDEIRSMNPPGRFLKQDPHTKLWSDVGEKKALDKTRQALREGAPELLKEIDGGDSNSVDYKFENQDALGPLRVARQNNPLANSLMGNISLGSFSLNSLEHQRGTEPVSTPPLPGIPGQIQTTLAAAQATSNMGSEQVAALLNAIHNHAANNSASDIFQQQLTQQLITQNFLNQMNNSNSTFQAGNFSAGNFSTGNLSNNSNQNIQHGFHFQQNAVEQHEDSTVPANVLSSPKGTSRARAQRIGLKNSFTQQRRPNRHLKNNEQALMGNSLLSVESINMDQLRMSGVSLGEFTGSEMSKLFESDRDMGKEKDKTDDVSEVSDAMSDDAMSEDEKERSK
ncbi:hypothetical protein ACHAXM_011901 [Skeletonema potamos]